MSNSSKFLTQLELRHKWWHIPRDKGQASLLQSDSSDLYHKGLSAWHQTTIVRLEIQLKLFELIVGPEGSGKKSNRPEWQRNILIPCNLCRVGVVDLVGVFDAVPQIFC